MLIKFLLGFGSFKQESKSSEGYSLFHFPFPIFDFSFVIAMNCDRLNGKMETGKWKIETTTNLCLTA